MLLAEVARASAEVAATSSRTAKVAVLATCLRSAAAQGDPEVVAAVVSFLSGELRQRRTGLGWAALRDAPGAARTAGAAADREPLTVEEVDAAFARAEGLAGPGSQAARRSLLHGLLARADESERRLLSGLVTGELRQGAQEGVLLDAVAAASGLPGTAVRRAVTLAGSVAEVAVAALTHGEEGLAAYRLQVGRPLSPMLAQSAPDLEAALERTGPAGVEWKLDGIRIQVHRDGQDVGVFTRTLDDVTDRLPEVVAEVLALPVRSAVLDGEALALRPDGRPRPFQETAARTATRAGPRGTEAARTTPLTTYVFDALHLDGTDLLDEDSAARRATLETLGHDRLLVPRVELADPADPASAAAAQEFAGDALARGHEGVVVKSLAAPYAMGRRGAGWVKVKPVHTLDLVVLAVEWGHGRRTGRLSNLHLGALDPQGRYGPAGGFVMLGKTFKGLTDELLAWQTEALLAIADGPTDGWVVRVRPELVVEIALDGVQTSPRYPAGMALRFARVLRYRPDKRPSDADTVDAVRALMPGP